MESRLFLVCAVLFSVASVRTQILNNVLNNLVSTAQNYSPLNVILGQNQLQNQRPERNGNSQFHDRPNSQNGCDQYFSYFNDNSNNAYGVVSIPNPDKQKNVVKTVLLVASRLDSSDYGEMDLLQSKEDAAYAVANGFPLQLRVRFPTQNPLPRTHQIYLNDQLLCSSQKQTPHLSTLTLTFTFSTNLPPSNQIYQNQHQIQGTSNNLQNFEASTSGTCSEYFSYRNDHTGTFGLLTIKAPDRYRNDVKAVMTLASRLHSNDYGSMQLFYSNEESVRAVDNGLPLLLKIRFPFQNPLPKIHQIYLNEKLICSQSKESDRLTFIELLATFTTNLPYRPDNTQPSPSTDQNHYYQSNTPNYYTTTTRYSQPPTRPTTRQTRPTTRYTTTRYTTTTSTTENPESEDDDRIIFLNNVCGVKPAKKTTTGLIKGGQSAIRGQFPWLVAYFYQEKHSNEFICGGSLISSQLVITAAHCVQEKGNAFMREGKFSTFLIGKHNLDSYTEVNYQTSTAVEIHVHPTWNTENNYRGDIAVAILVKEIVFNKFVKPICIWRETTSSSDIEGKEGVVAGWGKMDNDSISTSHPFFAKFPAVSGLQCILSDYRFNVLVSEYSFCGGKMGSDVSPCNGDSGGAFMFENDGKTYLRGVVSSGLIDIETQSCDTKKYAVYTDVSKYTDWIDEFVRNHG